LKNDSAGGEVGTVGVPARGKKKIDRETEIKEQKT